ncbi:tetratricopeptide repeat protein [Hymenobacter gummosus]|nr:tetratricopeptide repeat protein [Hymenobacter gummosus]
MITPEQFNQIGDLIWEAQGLHLRGKSAGAIKRYHEALALLGDAATESVDATTIYFNIGEIYWLRRDVGQALEYFRKAVHNKGGLGIAVLHLRLGQIRYEQGELAKAQDELMRAYLGAGAAVFADEDPKYYALIQPHIERT